MILEALAPPPAVERALQIGFASFADAGFQDGQEFSVERARFAHRVYVTAARDLAEGRFPDAAVLVGWRFLLWSRDGRPFAAEVDHRPGGAAAFSHVNMGPFAAGTVEALAALDRIRLPLRERNELRLIKAPELQLWLLWLAGADDLFVPIAPCPGRLRANKPYIRSALGPLLAKLAGAPTRAGRRAEVGMAP